jgi:hypothetical protein
LVDESVSTLEKGAQAAHFLSGLASMGGYIAEAAGELAKGPPNIIGFSLIGGARLEAPAYSGRGNGLQAIRSPCIPPLTPGLMDRLRTIPPPSNMEWTHLLTSRQNSKPIHIEAQLAVYEEQHKATELQLR